MYVKVTQAQYDVLIGAGWTFEAVIADAPVALTAAQPTAERHWATQAERAAGAGFSCSCGRNDLRTAPKSGSFHKAPNGKTHTIK